MDNLHYRMTLDLGKTNKIFYYSQPGDSSVMIEGDISFVDPSIFANIDEVTVAKAGMKTFGAAGPSGLDAIGWRHILLSRNYGDAGRDLRSSLAEMARTLATQKVTIQPDHSTSLEAFLSCRLIPLDKNPGVRPIGIGEVLRRIVGKAIIFTIKPQILESAGDLQLCAGHPAGCKAAVHAMSEIFAEEETDAVLLVDAANAFNSINRKVMLNNIQYIHPAMAVYTYNCYITASRLFVQGGKEISSVVKPNLEQSAKEIFAGTDVCITTDGHNYLGGYIGSGEGKSNYIRTLVRKWID